MQEPKANLSSPVIIFAAGGHATVVADLVERCGRSVLAFVDPAAATSTFLGAPLVRTCTELTDALGGSMISASEIVVALGDNARRRTIADQIRNDLPATRFATLVHPAATLARDVVIGPGSVVMAGATINIATVIGEHVIVNTGACIDHGCRIAEFASIAPGVVLGGNVSVGKYSAVGLGALVRQDISIGDDVVVGAGALVLGDLPAGVLAFGSPARVIRDRAHGEPYL